MSTLCGALKPIFITRDTEWKFNAIGADVNVRANLNRTPLIWLAMSQAKTVRSNGHGCEDQLVWMAGTLIDAGADVLHEDTDKGEFIIL